MHIYTLNDKEYPSVTTILKALGDEGIISWANFLGFKRIDYKKELERTSSFGTLVHSHIQKIVDPTVENVLKPLNSIEEFNLNKTLTNFRRYIDLFKYETIYSEKTIISESLGYAGTIDWVANMNNSKILCDFKTSKNVRMSMMLQLGGYYNLLRDKGEDVDYGAIMIVNPDKCKFNFITQADLRVYAKIFNIIAEFYLAMDYHNDPKPKIKEELEKEFMIQSV